MIGFIKGTLFEKLSSKVIVDVNGVGYEIEMPTQEFAGLPELGEGCLLYTHLIIREDSHSLCGFMDKAARDLFRVLLKVSGIGPKIALAMLSILSVQDIVNSINSDDLNTLCMVSGLGKKGAQRLVLELKGKLSDFSLGSSDIKTNTTSSISSKSLLAAQVIEALVGLGYSNKDALMATKNIEPDINDVAIAIKQALKFLNSYK